MAFTVNPPQIDEVTGQVIGEATVSHRDLSRQQLTINEPVDPNELNEALDPYYAQQAIQAQLPVFNPNATDADIISFWRDQSPLTEAQISALQAAYVATDNEDIANLVQYRLTGNDAFLSEQQRYELGLQSGLDDGTDSRTDDTGSDEDAPVESFTEDQIEGLLDNATEPNDSIANAILSADIGDNAASSVVQYLAYQYYSGAVSLDDAYNEALASGVSQEELQQAFTNLYRTINT